MMQKVSLRRVARSLFLLGAALVALTGCARPINREAEKRIRRALPDLLGPAREYRVRVDSDPFRTLQGRLSNVKVDGESVQMANGLLLDRLHLDIKGIEVDTDKGRVKKIRETRFTATVSKANLDEYLLGDAPKGETLRKMRLTLGDNQVTIAGEREVIKFGTPFEAVKEVRLAVPFEISGPLRVVGAQRMEIDTQRIRVVGIPLTGFIVDFLKSRFENAIDLKSLPFPVELTDVQTKSGLLILSGMANVQPILDKHSEKR